MYILLWNSIFSPRLIKLISIYSFRNAVVIGHWVHFGCFKLVCKILSFWFKVNPCFVKFTIFPTRFNWVRSTPISMVSNLSNNYLKEWHVFNLLSFNLCGRRQSKTLLLRYLNNLKIFWGCFLLDCSWRNQLQQLSADYYFSQRPLTLRK